MAHERHGFLYMENGGVYIYGDRLIVKLRVFKRKS